MPSSTRASSCLKDESNVLTTPRARTPLAIVQNSATDRQTATKAASRTGTTRPSRRAIARVTHANSRATTSSTPNTATATRPTENGRPVSTGGRSISARTEFCHSEAWTRKATATPMHSRPSTPLISQRKRPLAAGSSSQRHSPRPQTPMP